MAGKERLALLSVTDKGGLAEFARRLEGCGFKILSTGGTAQALRDAKVAVTEVAEFTGAAEILGGRVKTLHPSIHAGILARANHDGDRQDLVEHRLRTIDLVVVNLYRFEAAVAKFEESARSRPQTWKLTDPEIAAVLDNIDIGGPTLVRAAAKNSPRVTIVVDPSDYPAVATAFETGDGPDEMARARLAAAAFRRIAEYDAAIERFFAQQLGDSSAPYASRVVDQAASLLLDGALPDALLRLFEHIPVKDGTEARKIEGCSVLRYGENPHQKGLYLRSRRPAEVGVLETSQVSGKELSYNNLLDADSALGLVQDFTAPAAAIIKHNNPCGAAVAADLLDSFERAYAGDPLAAFGGIVAFNRPVTPALARRMASREHFFEVILAPEFTADSAEILKRGAPWGQNVRLLETGEQGGTSSAGRWEVRSVRSGWLVQQRDFEPVDAVWKTVSKRQLEDMERFDLQVAWIVARHVKSNAIVLVKDGAVVGVGAGQMSRVDSVEIAVHKAGARAKGSALGSDAFFPFRDGVDLAARAGVTAVIEPGGSKRDPEVIQACDEAGVVLVFTGVRHFRH